jgi:hypothetical protein
LAELPKFGDAMNSMLQSGRLEIMHRTFVLLYNLVQQGDKCREKADASGLIVFIKAFLDNYHQGSDLDFPPEEKALLPVIVKVGKDIVRAVEDARGQ